MTVMLVCSLRSMGHMTSYPASLKQLDLSHNQVCCWPSLPQIELLDAMEQAAITCYSGDACSKPARPVSGKPTLGNPYLHPFKYQIVNIILSVFFFNFGGF